MFILDFFLGGLMDQFIDWVYSQLVGFFGNFFAEMGNMGVELFEMSWVQSIVLFFSYLAWTLYVVGLVVAVFEVGIEYQTGRASIKDAAISAVKGFMAVGCFTLVPVELYKLSVTLQASLTSGITGYGESFDALSTDIINSLQGVDIGAAASSGVRASWRCCNLNNNGNASLAAANSNNTTGNRHWNGSAGVADLSITPYIIYCTV